MTKLVTIEPPEELDCPDCQIRLTERLVSNLGRWLVVRYSCRKCAYTSTRHTQRPELDPSPAISIRELVTGPDSHMR